MAKLAKFTSFLRQSNPDEGSSEKNVATSAIEDAARVEEENEDDDRGWWNNKLKFKKHIDVRHLVYTIETMRLSNYL